MLWEAVREPPSAPILFACWGNTNAGLLKAVNKASILAVFLTDVHMACRKLAKAELQGQAAQALLRLRQTAESDNQLHSQCLPAPQSFQSWRLTD